MNSTVKNLLALIKNALGKEIVPVSDDVNWNEIFSVSSSGRITTLVYYGIKASGVTLPEDIRLKFEDKLYKSTLLSTVNDYEVSKLLQIFRDKNIYHAPLKGLVVRNFYPSADMRTVGDADVLIKESDIEEISGILRKAGFVFDHESTHEHTWKKDLLIFELHKHFVGTGIKEFFNYYKNSEKFLHPGDAPGLHEMSVDDLFVYLVVHIAKHYRMGGIGLRHFIDLYVLLTSDTPPDESYVSGELERLGLGKFYSNVKNVLSCWFEGREFDDISKLITKKVFGSGIFGNNKDRFIADTTIHPVSKRVFFNVFLPYKYMKQKYPVLIKAPVLLPILWVARIFDIVFTKQSKITQYKKTLSSANQENVDNFHNDLKLVGLE